MDAEKQNKYLSIAIKAAHEAGKTQMESFGRHFAVHTKSSSNDLVTSVDLACDKLISEMLRKHCPGDQLLTEETYEEGQPIELSNTWVIDPIDGTTNYSHGFPHFATSMAYFENGVAQVGVIHDPFKKETFYALRGHGAFVTNPFLHDEELSVSNVVELQRALLATGFPYDVHRSEENNLNFFCRITRLSHGVRRPGAAALDLAYVAAGRLDGFWELKLSPWDIAAGALMVEEAGGRITDFHGNPMDYTATKPHIVATNDQAAIHDGLVHILSQEPDAVRQAESTAY